MADVLNLKINERLNVEWPNFRVTKTGNKNWKVKASKSIYINGQTWGSAKLQVVWSIEWTNNPKICQFLKQNFGFPNCKIFGIPLIVQILEFSEIC